MKFFLGVGTQARGPASGCLVVEDVVARITPYHLLLMGEDLT